MNIPKQITFISKDPDVVLNVLHKFCEPVTSTLGPNGCTVIIHDNESNLPHVTKDGVTVSESINFSDPREQAIASLIKEAARKTAASVGDGTTTSVLLVEQMLLRGLSNLSTVKSRRDFFEGFDLAFERLVDILTENNVPITKDSTLLESVVRISANGDDKLCKLIMSAVKASGPDGLVSAELHDELRTFVDVKGGSSLESTAFIPSKRWESTGIVDLILVAGPIKEVHEIKGILTMLSTSKNDCVIIAKEFSESVLNTVSVNNHRKSINVALVESEGFARNHRMDILEDLSAIFSVPIYSTDGSTDLPIKSWSSCATGPVKAIVKPNETILFREDESWTPEAEERYAKLKKEYDDSKISTEEDSVIDSGLIRHLQRRIAKYNVVATIKIGAATQAEAAEMKDRVEDALCAVSAAVNGGITEGGGMALLKAAKSLIPAVDTMQVSADYKAGYMLVLNACSAPFSQLCKNSGLEMVEIPEELLAPGNVFDFRDYEIVHFVDGGIVDPVLVPIACLTNATSVVKTILKSNSIISEWQELRAVSS
jgi:chaperonin GroEL (HSP60 family)